MSGHVTGRSKAVQTTAAVRVDQNRLWQRHTSMARIGATPAGGLNRQAFTVEDAEARKLLLGWAAALGFSPSTDAIGNLFIRRAGANPKLAPVVTGSHLDSQPAGGPFDGTYGVLAGFELLEALQAADIATVRPIELAVWANEEGSRFQPTTMGSAVFAGALSVQEALAARDSAGRVAADALCEMQAVMPPMPIRDIPFPIHAYVEAHIEQGPILERNDAVIGIVSGIQGLRWYRVTVQGETGHAGTTPSAARRDALVSAIDMIAALRHTMKAGDPDVRFTVGRFEVRPGSPNTIPGEVAFTIDLRHPREDMLERLGDVVAPICRRTSGPCEVDVVETLRSPPVVFDPAIIKAIQGAADRRGFRSLQLVSGATHDAKFMAPRCRSGMVFIPCKDGVSHSESEEANPEHMAAGAQVLLDVILSLATIP